MAKKVFLTTVDNPYDPDTQFTSWYLYDKQKGYDSCDYLARIARTSNQLSDEENVDEILKAEIGKVFVKVLEDAGVFKRDKKGREYFMKFIESV